MAMAVLMPELKSAFPSAAMTAPSLSAPPQLAIFNPSRLPMEPLFHPAATSRDGTIAISASATISFATPAVDV